MPEQEVYWKKRESTEREEAVGGKKERVDEHKRGRAREEEEEHKRGREGVSEEERKEEERVRRR